MNTIHIKEFIMDSDQMKIDPTVLEHIIGINERYLQSKGCFNKTNFIYEKTSTSDDDKTFGEC